MRRSLRPVPLAALAAAVLFFAGCGSGGTGVVSGKVTVNGKPLKKGLITFSSEVGNRDAFNAAVIDGAYKTGEVPCGPAKVTVYPAQVGAQEMTEEAKGGGDRVPVGARKAGRALAPEVPSKYGNADTSGLSFTVKRGDNEYSVELAP
jgi:hypothetical protein